MSIRLKFKDNIFTYLFRNPENVLRLYKDLHPEDTTVELSDIKNTTIDTVMVKGLYNDLGFTVRNNLIILLEAQSTWNPNMPIRLLLYLAESYKRYIDENDINIYSQSVKHFPVPEFYILYKGNKKNVPDTLTLSETAFNGVKSDIEIKVNVLTEINDTIYGQYNGFCDVYNTVLKMQNISNEEKAKTVINYCISSGYLVDIMSSLESEVITMLETLFDNDSLMDAHDKEVLEKGFEKGIEQQTAIIVKNLLTSTDMKVKKIAELTGTTIEYVKSIKSSLKEAK